MKIYFKVFSLLSIISCSLSNYIYSQEVAINLGGTVYYNGQTAYVDCATSQIRPHAFKPGETLSNPTTEWNCSSNIAYNGETFWDPTFTLDPNRNDGHITVKLNNAQMTLYITQKTTPTLTISPNLCTSGESADFSATLNYYGPTPSNVVWETTGGVTVNNGSYFKVDNNTISRATVQYNSFGTLSVYGEIPGCNNMQTKKQVKILGPPQLYNFSVNFQSYNPNTNGIICVGSNQSIQAAISYNTQSANWSISSGNSYNASLYSTGNIAAFSPAASFTPMGSGYFAVDLQLGNICGTALYTIGFNAYDCYSTYKVYPNPAMDYVTIEFEDIQDISSLPDEMSLFSDGSNLAIKTINVQEEFSKKRLKDGNKVEFSIKNFPRGTYYLHIKNNRHKNKTLDIKRIVFE